MTHYLLLLFANHPRATALVSALLFLASAALLVHFSLEYSAFPPSPIKMRMAEAMGEAKRRDVWVELTDAQWRCDVPIASSGSGNSNVALSSADRSRWVVATLDRSAVDCSDLRETAPAGVLGAMSAKKKKRLMNAGLIPPDKASSVQSLCCYCGRTNALLGIALAGLMMLASLSLVPLFRRLRRQMQAAEANV